MYNILGISLCVIESIFIIVFGYIGYNCAKTNINEGGIVVYTPNIFKGKNGKIYSTKPSVHIEEKTTFECIWHGYKEALSYVGPVNLFLVVIFVSSWLVCKFLWYLINKIYSI